MYFARIRVKGKLIRRYLKTQVLSVARLRLGDLEKEERQIAEHATAYVEAQMDWRCDPGVDRVDFTFEGNDEMDPVSGRGGRRLREGRCSDTSPFTWATHPGLETRKPSHDQHHQYSRLREVEEGVGTMAEELGWF